MGHSLRAPSMVEYPHRVSFESSPGQHNAQPGSVEHSMLDFASRQLNIGHVFRSEGTTEWLITTQCLPERS